MTQLLVHFHYADNARLPYSATCLGTVLYLFYEHIGSLRVAANRNGDIVRKIEYESFGHVVDDTNPGLHLGYGFAGGLHDPDTGFVRFWVRDYDPKLGRFLSPDPVWHGERPGRRAEERARAAAEAGQQAVDPDRYGYCLDDPVNMVDPDGLDADCISIEGNAAGFGFKGELGAGGCWDDNGEVRLMGHADAGGSTGWGGSVSGTWQSTDAEAVDDLAGQSVVSGVSQAVAPGPWGSKITVGADKVNASAYDGEAYSVGLGWGTPTVTDVHTQIQNTILVGGQKK